MGEEVPNACEYFSKIRGYHIYKDIWTAAIGELLLCKREVRNISDPYAVAVVNGEVVVGHVPRSISTLCSLFLDRGGVITCEVIGPRQYSRDLPQGGLELPCKLTFSGQAIEVAKVSRLLQYAPGATVISDKSTSTIEVMPIDLTNSDAILSENSSDAVKVLPISPVTMPSNSTNSVTILSVDSFNSARVSLANPTNCVTMSSVSLTNSVEVSSVNSTNSVVVSSVNSTNSVVISSVSSTDSAKVSSVSPTNLVKMSSANTTSLVAVKSTSSSLISSISEKCITALPISAKKVSSYSLDDSVVQPEKKRQKVDSSPVITSFDQVWLKVGSHKLSLHDQMMLMNGEDLSDRHINFAQYLLHTQFPAMQGLVLTLLQEKTIATKLPAGSVQIIHNSRRHHWLVATTKNCTRNEVKIYDSLYKSPDAEVRRIIKNLFQTTSNPSFIMLKMQKQEGNHDCGVFAIAVATSLAHSTDPVHFQQDQMRSHLHRCFENNKLTLFPCKL